VTPGDNPMRGQKPHALRRCGAVTLRGRACQHRPVLGTERCLAHQGDPPADQVARCGARTRGGKPCQAPKVDGMTRCRLHGGSTPTGIASPHYRHGRHSRHLPTGLLERFQDALADQDQLSLRPDLALIDARVAELLRGMADGGSPDAWRRLRGAWRAYQEDRSPEARTALANAIEQGASASEKWAEIIQHLNVRRRLCQAESQRELGHRNAITLEQAMGVFAAVAESIRAHVHDPDARRRIQDDLGRLLTNVTH